MAPRLVQPAFFPHFDSGNPKDLPKHRNPRAGLVVRRQARTLVTEKQVSIFREMHDKTCLLHVLVFPSHAAGVNTHSGTSANASWPKSGSRSVFRVSPRTRCNAALPLQEVCFRGRSTQGPRLGPSNSHLLVLNFSWHSPRILAAFPWELARRVPQWRARFFVVRSSAKFRWSLSAPHWHFCSLPLRPLNTLAAAT